MDTMRMSYKDTLTRFSGVLTRLHMYTDERLHCRLLSLKPKDDAQGVIEGFIVLAFSNGKTFFSIICKNKAIATEFPTATLYIGSYIVELEHHSCLHASIRNYVNDEKKFIHEKLSLYLIASVCDGHREGERVRCGDSDDDWKAWIEVDELIVRITYRIISIVPPANMDENNNGITWARRIYIIIDIQLMMTRYIILYVHVCESRNILYIGTIEKHDYRKNNAEIMCDGKGASRGRAFGGMVYRFRFHARGPLNKRTRK
ncbi:hypothetical protein AGLY_010465 [Aphis glycines]|uniref:Uncharacterized protein n=1 Tax=Aphis glycines TaxID=307491 RepID=A0A6G0TDM2_APHGL|nr:hypothetical protein AGLY_010465 [Aphis glycines]